MKQLLWMTDDSGDAEEPVQNLLCVGPAALKTGSAGCL